MTEVFPADGAGRAEDAGGAGGINDVFDASYAHFWADELGGRRLAGDIARITAVAAQVGVGGTGRPPRVLDLGCAFGRIANKLAAEGMDVTAVDQSAELLALARAAAPDPPPAFVLDDMRTLVMPDSFDLALLWFSTFGYFDDEQNREVLDRVFASLRAGGALIMETRNWDRIHREFEPWSVRSSGPDVLIERHEFIPRSGRQETTQLALIGGKWHQRSYFLRRYTGAELTAILLGAGFAEVHLYGEDLSPLTVEHKRLIAVAVRSSR